MLAADGSYRTKKELKASVGKLLRYVETSIHGYEFNPNGSNVVVGPSAYERKWFAKVTCAHGFIIKVE